MRHLLLLFITLYQKTLSPDHGWLRGFWPNGYCRYHPSCSEYARQSILRHGSWRGAGQAFLRVLRCNPWSRGGLDPVE